MGTDYLFEQPQCAGVAGIPCPHRRAPGRYKYCERCGRLSSVLWKRAARSTFLKDEWRDREKSRLAAYARARRQRRATSKTLKVQGVTG